MLLNIVWTAMVVAFVVITAGTLAVATFTTEAAPLKINEHEGFLENA